jgi:Holliday junction resolvasome RuvABC ATP-dependent DNA helicase subunit
LDLYTNKKFKLQIRNLILNVLELVQGKANKLQVQLVKGPPGTGKVRLATIKYSNLASMLFRRLPFLHC